MLRLSNFLLLLDSVLRIDTKVDVFTYSGLVYDSEVSSFVASATKRFSEMQTVHLLGSQINPSREVLDD